MYCGYKTSGIMVQFRQRVAGNLLLLLLLSVSCVRRSTAQQNCAQTMGFGESNPESEDRSEDRSDTGFLMLDSRIEVTCCGFATGWETEIRYRSPGDPQCDTLIGTTTFEPCCQHTDYTTSIPDNDQYIVYENDVIGWYSLGLDLIRYNNGTRDTNMIYNGIGASVVDDEIDWNVLRTSIANDRDYGIRLDVRPSVPPKFSNLDATVTIANTVGTAYTVITAVATDTDVVDVDAGLTYGWIANDQFTFDDTTQLLKTATLDPAPSVQRVLITVSDLCLNIVTTTVTVSITNEPPAFNTTIASATVNETETVQRLLYTFTCTDPTEVPTVNFDAATDAQGYPFDVQLLPSSTTYVLYNLANPGFNYTIKSSYEMTVECSDTYSKDTMTITVYLIKNAAPVVQNLQAATSISASDSIGTSVFNVTTTDAENDMLTYSFYCDPAPCSVFDVTDYGQVLLSENIIASTIVAYDLYITVSDGYNTVGPSILTVTVAEINSPVTLTNLPLGSSQSVSEDTAAGTSLFTASYSDVDTQTHVFSLSASGSGNDYFKIDSSTGVVSLKSQLDYETLEEANELTFSLDITVSDGATSDTQPLQFHVTNVNDAPAFSQGSFSLSADEGGTNATVGSPPYNVIDADTEDVLAYAGECGAYTSLFYFDTDTGSVSYQSDYDMDAVPAPPGTHACTVTVRDKAGASDTTNLTITINNINDNKPIFVPATYTLVVSYYTSTATTIGTVTALDGDAGTYGDLTYSIDNTVLGNEYFGIDSNGNVIMLLSPSGIGIGVLNTITVTATDTGGLSSEATIKLIVGDSTTSTTTTTTDSYYHFADDSRSWPWVICTILAGMVSACVIAWTIYTCRGPESCAAFRHYWFRKRKTYVTSRRRSSTPESPPTRMTYTRTGPPPQQPPPLNEGPVRHPPPPTDAMAWRAQMGDKVAPPASGQFNFWRNNMNM